MAKIVVAEFVSADGFIARPDGNMEGFNAEGDTTEHLIEVQRQWDCLLMGRVAYEMVRGWADAPVEGNPIAKFMNTVPKVVVSRTLREAPWGRWPPARVVRNVAKEIRQQRARKGKDTAILGSGKLVQHLLAHGWVDELLLDVHPVAFGRGKTWAPAHGPDLRLTLVGAKADGSGIVSLRYRVKKRR